MKAIALALAVAVAPGVIAWWRGRAIVAARSEAGAAERLAAHRTWVGWLAALTALGISVAGPDGSWVCSGAVLLASIAGYFPARRAVLGERWGLVGYLGFLGAVGLGFFGHLLLLISVPALVPPPGSDRWGVVALLAGTLLVWSGFRGAVLQRLLGARVLDRPGLADRCRAIAERAAIAFPALLRGGPRSGSWPQTVCWVEDKKRSAVLFSETLLAALDDASWPPCSRWMPLSSSTTLPSRHGRG